jgi:hypothetical protein
MRNRFLSWLGATLAVLLLFGPLRAEGAVNPPTGERDLILFIAKFKPHLYRLVGQEPSSYGSARFYNPQSIVAAPVNRCFYVLDLPRLVTEPVKIWRIAADGTPTLAFQANKTIQGGPFGKPVGLGLDAGNRLLVADTVTGLWRLEPNGFLQRLFDGKEKPLYKISAATGTAQQGLILATSYLYAIGGGEMLNLPRERFGTWSPAPSYQNLAVETLGRTGVGNSTGRQVPIRIWKNQGGLYRVTPPEQPRAIEPLLANQRPGGEEYDTYWRTARQLFADDSGRLLLVDAGSVWKRTETVYTGGRRTDHPQTRKTQSVINGGIFVLHPNGRFEELTFKTPTGSAGPLRRPEGAAQWSDDTYLIADPKMYVKGVSGTGGLLLLKLDGSREARWPFGARLQPLGVAILRGAGPPAKTPVTRAVRIEELVGVRTGSRITRIEQVTWQRKPQKTRSLLGPIGMNWPDQPRAQAEARLRAVFENARWSIAPDGALRFSAAGVSPQQEATPHVMTGTVTQLGEMLSISAKYKSSMFDTQLGTLDVRIRGGEQGEAIMSISTNLFTKTERIKATFEQILSR